MLFSCNLVSVMDDPNSSRDMFANSDDAPTRAIADRLTDVFGVHYSSKDIINRVNKIDTPFDSDKKNIEVFLEQIKNGGGKVLAKYHEGSC